MNRRAFMFATVGAAWAVPQILTVSPASAAALTSEPPQPKVPSEPAQTVEIDLGVQERDARGELAFTGANIGVESVAGVGAVASGAALLLWRADAAH